MIPQFIQTIRRRLWKEKGLGKERLGKGLVKFLTPNEVFMPKSNRPANQTCPLNRDFDRQSTVRFVCPSGIIVISQRRKDESRALLQEPHSIHYLSTDFDDATLLM